MATTKTTKTTTTRRAPRARTTTGATKTSTGRTKTETSVAARAGKVIAKRPVASAAIATGLVSGITAAVAGFLAFKKSGKSFSEFSGDIATSVKDKASETSERVKDGLADARTIARDQVSELRDGIDSNGKTQSEFAEEALSLKEIGSAPTFPNDPVIESQTKIGSVSY